MVLRDAPLGDLDVRGVSLQQFVSEEPRSAQDVLDFVVGQFGDEAAAAFPVEGLLFQLFEVPLTVLRDAVEQWDRIGGVVDGLATAAVAEMLRPWIETSSSPAP